MPKKSTHSPSGSSFFPPNDQATYRDLLLFEERLKTNALTLNRRKSRYQCAFHLLLTELLDKALCTHTSFRRAIPSVYGPDAEVHLPPYVASGLLFVSVTTLLLFFATGLYSEKIGYANRYLPRVNRALRNFNMYLNMRQAPRRSPFDPLSYLFPRPSFSGRSAPQNRARSSSPTRLGKRSSSTVPMPSIPPTTNPRGELIFSSRVERVFREAYERYRTAFERKRDERERQAAARTWSGWLLQKLPWNRPVPPTTDSATPTPSQSRVGSLAVRGRIVELSSGASPASSGRSTPAASPEPSRGRPTAPSVGT
ncbi:hypothetical protein BJY52DRAFT_1292135 [Lactarius psammicola]|nr:hypothetical protein BJY52DRAFT_1292135 [Lactarius psammicola]